MILKMRGTPLRLSDWSESSQVVTMLTDRCGKIAAVAKGSRRPGRAASAFDGPFDYLCSYDLVLWKPEGPRLGVWMESHLRSRPDVFLRDLSVQRYGLSCLERSRELLEEEEPTRAWEHLRKALGSMIQGLDARGAHNTHTLGLLKDGGFGPATGYCVVDGREKRGKGPAPYSARLGGVLCPGCESQDPGAVRVSPEILERLGSSPETQAPLGVKEEKLVTRLLTATVEHLVGKPLRLSPFMRAACLVGCLLSLGACFKDPRPPEVIFQEGVGLLEQNAYIRASWRFEDIQEQYPEHPLAAEGAWIMALDCHRREEGSDARRWLDMLLKKYPDSDNYDRAYRKQYEILAGYFDANIEEVDGRRGYDVSDTALEQMEHLADYAPFSPIADDALMRVADARFADQDFDKAEVLYQEILDRLDRFSPLQSRAQFQLAMCHWDRAVVRVRGFFDRHLRNPLKALSPSDRSIAVRFSERFPLEAAKEFEEVIRLFPDSPEAVQSRKILREIEELKAHRLLVLGDFYRFYDNRESALYYYRKASRDFAASEAQKECRTRLGEMTE